MQATGRLRRQLVPVRIEEHSVHEMRQNVTGSDCPAARASQTWMDAVFVNVRVARVIVPAPTRHALTQILFECADVALARAREFHRCARHLARPLANVVVNARIAHGADA